MTARRYQRAIDTRGEERTARYRTLDSAAVAAWSRRSRVVRLRLVFQLLALAAVAAGWWALRRIRYAPEELTGAEIAWTGMGLAVVFCPDRLRLEALDRGVRHALGYQVIAFEDLHPTRRTPRKRSLPRPRN